MTEYVRLVDAGLIRVQALSWDWWGLGAILVVVAVLVLDAARVRARTGRSRP